MTFLLYFLASPHLCSVKEPASRPDRMVIFRHQSAIFLVSQLSKQSYCLSQHLISSFTGLFCGKQSKPGLGNKNSLPAQSPLKLFQLTNLKLAQLASPIPSHRNQDKNSATFSLCLLCLLMDPSASMCGPAWQDVPFLLATMSNKLFTQWQLLPDLFASFT